jgi:hypothetical protein
LIFAVTTTHRDSIGKQVPRRWLRTTKFLLSEESALNLRLAQLVWLGAQQLRELLGR